MDETCIARKTKKYTHIKLEHDGRKTMRRWRDNIKMDLDKFSYSHSQDGLCFTELVDCFVCLLVSKKIN
jgi:hypothetical protein